MLTTFILLAECGLARNELEKLWPHFSAITLPPSRLPDGIIFRSVADHTQRSLTEVLRPVAGIADFTLPAAG